MEIVLPEKHTLEIKWFRRMSRYDTLTDVKFLNEDTLICANRECGKIYLIKFSLNPTQANVIFKTDTVFNNNLKYIDLFFVNNDLIYFVSLDNTIGCLKLENNRLIKHNLITVPGNFYFHSITFHPTDKDIVYLAGALYNPKLVVFNIKTKEILHEISLKNMPGQLLKDVKFLNENTIAVSGSGGLISKTNKNQTYTSKLGVYNSNTFEPLDVIEFENSHTDGLGIDEQNNIYIACQGDSSENILKFKFEDNKLVKLKGYSLPQFPHGFDVKYGLIASSSMKNSSICLLPI
jgi:WD40 repeat protein